MVTKVFMVYLLCDEKSITYSMCTYTSAYLLVLPPTKKQACHRCTGYYLLANREGSFSVATRISLAWLIISWYVIVYLLCDKKGITSPICIHTYQPISYPCPQIRNRRVTDVLFRTSS